MPGGALVPFYCREVRLDSYSAKWRQLAKRSEKSCPTMRGPVMHPAGLTNEAEADEAEANKVESFADGVFARVADAIVLADNGGEGGSAGSDGDAGAVVAEVAAIVPSAPTLVAPPDNLQIGRKENGFVISPGHGQQFSFIEVKNSSEGLQVQVKLMKLDAKGNAVGDDVFGSAQLLPVDKDGKAHFPRPSTGRAGLRVPRSTCMTT